MMGLVCSYLGCWYVIAMGDWSGVGTVEWVLAGVNVAPCDGRHMDVCVCVCEH